MLLITGKAKHDITARYDQWHYIRVCGSERYLSETSPDNLLTVHNKKEAITQK
jgi:hypothetical protein